MSRSALLPSHPFGDIFLLITCLFAGLALIALLMKKPALGKAASAH